MGLGSEVCLGVALGSLGLCGVHVHFYKFIVVGSKSMPRGVSPKVGVWWWRKLQCKYLNLKTEWLWAQKGCWEAQHCHRWSMKQHTVCWLSSAASQSPSSRAVRRPRKWGSPGANPLSRCAAQAAPLTWLTFHFLFARLHLHMKKWKLEKEPLWDQAGRAQKRPLVVSPQQTRLLLFLNYAVFSSRSF